MAVPVVVVLEPTVFREVQVLAGRGSLGKEMLVVLMAGLLQHHILLEVVEALARQAEML
jgi:hypothetical protein